MLTTSSSTPKSTSSGGFVVLNQDAEEARDESVRQKRDSNSLINLSQLTVPSNNHHASVVSSYSSSLSKSSGVSGGSRSTRIVINGSRICRTSHVEVTPSTIHNENLTTAEDDDDIPEILLKEASSSTPTTKSIANVHSPSRKRVSPPHGHHLLHQQSSSSIEVIKTGRKFILKALPPPLTPCLQSKTHIQEDDPIHSGK